MPEEALSPVLGPEKGHMMRHFLLHGVFSKLASTSPWVYILLYVLVILGFASIYHSRSRDFYHPYARYERELGEEAATIRSILTEKYQDRARANRELTKQITLLSEEVHVGGIRPDGGLLYVDLVVKLEGRTKKGNVVCYSSIPYVLQTRKPSFMEEPNGRRTYLLLGEVNGDYKSGLTTLGTLIDDPKGAEEKLIASFFRLDVTEDVFNRVQAFQSGAAGFPNEVPGGFGRMLYLSVITVSTLGYGDIVPLTWQTRLFTGIEATLGIILLGLFVSSMVSDRNRGGP